MKGSNVEYNLFVHQIEHEEALRKLYKSYHKLFPEEEIWEQLESEEKKHADVIHPIILKVMDETIFFKEPPENYDMIRRSLSRIMSEISKAEKKEVDLIEALETSIEIEETMIERNFFKSMGSYAPFIEDILENIVVETEKHRGLLIGVKNKYIRKYNSAEYIESKKETDKKANIVTDRRVSGYAEKYDEDINLDRNFGS